LIPDILHEICKPRATEAGFAANPRGLPNTLAGL
jgi:hypothetical protein